MIMPVFRLKEEKFSSFKVYFHNNNVFFGRFSDIMSNFAVGNFRTRVLYVEHYKEMHAE